MKQKPGAAKLRRNAAKAARKRHAQRPKPTVLKEDSPEFDAACREALKRVVAKYCYTAQQVGIVLRKNPLKLAPYQDFYQCSD